MPETRTRWVVGCMTGTSLDGLDAALVKIEGAGLDMRATFAGMVSKPLSDLAQDLKHLAEGNPAKPIDYLRAARRLGELHADAVEELLANHKPHATPPSAPGSARGSATQTDPTRNTLTSNPSAPHAQPLSNAAHQHAAGDQPHAGPRAKPGAEGAGIDFVVAHGQTIWHAPCDAVGRLSWQLFDPWPIVHRLNVPVCYDLRQADLIAGGEGAPITPIADWVMYRHHSECPIVINLGGVCSASWLINKDAIGLTNQTNINGTDVGPCNLMIDGLTQRLISGLDVDLDGQVSRGASVHQSIVDWILSHSFFRRDFPKTTGREEFGTEWLDRLAAFVRDAQPEEVIASAIAAVGEMIKIYIDSTDVWPTTDLLVLAGGGVRNPTLVQAIKHAVASGRYHRPRTSSSSDLGIPCEAREAMAFAVLGVLSQDGVPITLPQVTGATDPGVAGVWARPGNV